MNEINKPILEVVVGSNLHGTAVSDGLEDLDLMAIVIEKKEQIIGFNIKDTWVERTKPEGVRSEAGDVDRTVYGLKKYLHLALKGNPTILLALFAPQEFIKHSNAAGMELQSLAPRIVSQRVFMPFKGYMRQQHERLLGLRGQKNVTRPELVDAYGYDTKYASHIVRLGLQGEEILLTGEMTLPMRQEHREIIVDIRTGKYSLPQISELISEAENRLVSAKEKTALAEKPDIEYIEKWMIKKYLSSWAVQPA